MTMLLGLSIISAVLTSVAMVLHDYGNTRDGFCFTIAFTVSTLIFMFTAGAPCK